MPSGGREKYSGALEKGCQCMAPSREADTQRSEHTPRSWRDSCWLCPLAHSCFAPWFVPSHQWVLTPFFQAPSGPSSPRTAALKGPDQRVALAAACPGARAGRGRGRLTSLWVPSGPRWHLQSPQAVVSSFQPSCSDLDPLAHLVQPCQWDLCSTGSPCGPQA